MVWENVHLSLICCPLEISRRRIDDDEDDYDNDNDEDEVDDDEDKNVNDNVIEDDASSYFYLFLSH